MSNWRGVTESEKTLRTVPAFPRDVREEGNKPKGASPIARFNNDRFELVRNYFVGQLKPTPALGEIRIPRLTEQRMPQQLQTQNRLWSSMDLYVIHISHFPRSPRTGGKGRRPRSIGRLTSERQTRSLMRSKSRANRRGVAQSNAITRKRRGKQKHSPPHERVGDARCVA